MMDTVDFQKFSQPSYSKLVMDVWSTIFRYWSDLDPSYKTPVAWLALIKQHGSVSTQDIVLVILFAFLWTWLRHVVTIYIFKPITSISGLNSQEARKAPESAWKLIFYFCTWLYSYYVLFFTSNNFFFDVSSTFIGWKAHSAVPMVIYIAYVVHMSFYVHSVYATWCVDAWRKDSVVMLLHHFVTMFLIGFSYTFRYTKVGILVLFFHDITDVLLEGTKLAVYFKTKGGLWFKICDTLSTIGFILFGITWFVFRLYWFPLKVLYATGYISCNVGIEPVFYLFFNGLLWTLLCMNIYWFMFIVLMAYRIVTKQANEIDDTREYSPERRCEAKKRK